MTITTNATFEIDEKQIVTDELRKYRDIFSDYFHNEEIATILDEALYNYLRLKGKEY